MIAESRSYPRRKFYMESLRCLVSHQSAQIFVKEQAYQFQQQPYQETKLRSIIQYPKEMPVDNRFFKSEMSEIESVGLQPEAMDPEEQRKQKIIEKIKSRLCSAASNRTMTKSARPTTTCTLNSPIRSRPSTQLSSCRVQSKAARRITEYLSRSPDREPQESADQFLQRSPPSSPIPVSNDAATDQKPAASRVLRRLSYTDNISGCHNFLRKGSSIARKMMGNFIEKASDKLSLNLQQSLNPYNQKLLKQFNQIIPVGFCQSLQAKKLTEMAKVLRGPQPLSKLPNSAFFRSTASPLKQTPQQPAAAAPTQKHRRSASNLTTKSKRSSSRRSNRKAQITGWEYS